MSEGRLDLDDRIIPMDGVVWTGVIRLRIGTIGGLL
jgi:hypothetical protein